MVKKSFGTPLNGDERIAICTHENRLQTALLFDRIIIPQTRSLENTEIPPEIGLSIPELDEEGTFLAINKILKAKERGVFDAVVLEETTMTTFVELYENHLGLSVVPIFSHRTAYQHSYPSGDAMGYQAALENIPIVSEKSLDWEKVLRFRRDKDAASKYRDLYLWLKYGLEAKSLKDAKQVISQKIDDYTFALEKYEVETYLGVLEQLLAWDKAAMFTAVTTAAVYWQGPIAAALAGGFLIGASALASIKRRQLDAQAIRHSEGREVAILVEARKRFSNSAG